MRAGSLGPCVRAQSDFFNPIALTRSLPPRVGKKGSGAAKRWAFWLLFAIVGASSVVLTKSRHFKQLKA